jgi:nucleoid DNA-binding protein
MIKDDIVKRVSETLSIKAKDALPVVDEVFECMKDIIVEEGRLEIRDFGVFQTKRRKARVGRNPRDKVEYPIPQRKVVTFKAGKVIKASAEEIAQRALEQERAKALRNGHGKPAKASAGSAKGAAKKASAPADKA